MNLINSISNLTTSNNAQNPVKLGKTIYGYKKDFSTVGAFTSMNAIGDRVAFVTSYAENSNEIYSRLKPLKNIAVHQYNGLDWIQLGSNIIGNNIDPNYKLGPNPCVDMNDAGNRIVIGNPLQPATNIGEVKVYSFNGYDWEQLGNTILGGNLFFGRSVSMNAAGDRIVVSSGDIYLNSKLRGGVEVYSFNGLNWIRLGSPIVGFNDDFRFGFSVSMSKDGNKILVSEFLGEKLTCGVYAFFWDNNNWNQLGSKIELLNESIYDIAINEDLTRIIIGAFKVYTFYWVNGNWSPMDAPIFRANCDPYGYCVTMNKVGNRIAISTRTDFSKNTWNGILRQAEHWGVAEMYFWNGVVWKKLCEDIPLNNDYFFNQPRKTLSMNDSGDKISIGSPGNASIYPDIDSRYSYSSFGQIEAWGKVEVYLIK